jgi:hypothetical protein
VDPVLALGPVLSPTQALVAAIVVVVLVLLIWKFVKGAFKIAVVVGIAILIYLGLKAAKIV